MQIIEDKAAPTVAPTEKPAGPGWRIWRYLPHPVEQPIDPSIEERLATPDAFRAWLGLQYDLAVVGYANKSDRCPLKNWLSTLYPTATDLEVHRHSVLMGKRQIPLSRWAKEFVRRVDDRSVVVYCAITTREALRLLDVY